MRSAHSPYSRRHQALFNHPLILQENCKKNGKLSITCMLNAVRLIKQKSD